MAKVGYTGTVYGDPEALALAAEQNLNASADAIVAGSNTGLGVDVLTSEQLAMQQQQARDNLKTIKENNMSTFDHTIRGITKSITALAQYPADALSNVYFNTIGFTTGETELAKKDWNSLTEEEKQIELARKQDIFWGGTQLGQLLNATSDYVTGKTKDLNTGSDFWITENSPIDKKVGLAQANIAGWDSPDEYGNRATVGNVTAHQLMKLQHGSAEGTVVSTIADLGLIAVDLVLGGKALNKISEGADIATSLISGQAKAYKQGAQAATVTSAARQAAEEVNVFEAAQKLQTVKDNIVKRFGQEVFDTIDDVSKEAVAKGGKPSDTVYAELERYGKFLEDALKNDGANVRATALDESIAVHTADETDRIAKLDAVSDSTERGKLASEMSFYTKEADKVKAIKENETLIAQIDNKIKALEDSKAVDGADINAIDEQIANFTNTRNSYLQNAEIIKQARIGEGDLTADTLHGVIAGMNKTIVDQRILPIAPLENSINAAKANIDKWTAARNVAKTEVRLAKKELTIAKKSGDAKVVKAAELKVSKAEAKVVRTENSLARHTANHGNQVKALSERIANNERLTAVRGARESVAKEARLYEDLSTMQSLNKAARDAVQSEAIAKAEAIRIKYGIATEGAIDTYDEAMKFLNDVMGMRVGAHGEEAINVESALNWATKGGIKSIVESIKKINEVSPAEAASRILSLTRGKFDIETVRLLSNTTDDKEIMAILMEAMVNSKTGFNVGKLKMLQRGARVYTKNGELIPLENLRKASTSIGEGFDRLLIWGYDRKMTNTPWSYNFDPRDANSMVYALNDMIEFAVGTFGIPTGAVRQMKIAKNHIAEKYLGRKPTFVGTEGAAWRSFKNKYVTRMVNANTANERRLIWDEAQLELARLNGENAGLHLIPTEPKILKDGTSVPQTQLDVYVDAFKHSLAARNQMIARMARLKIDSKVKNVKDTVKALGAEDEIADDAIIYGEFLNYTVGMINPYEMRKMIQSAKTINELYTTKGLTVTVNGVEKTLGLSAVRKAVFDLTTDMYDRFFRRAMLFRVGYVIRNVVETQVRMYLEGHPNTLTNPMLWFSLKGVKNPDEQTLNIIKQSLDNAQLDARGIPFVKELENDGIVRAEFEMTELQKINNRGSMVDPGNVIRDPDAAKRVGFEFAEVTDSDYAEGLATHTYRMISNELNRDVLSASLNKPLRSEIWEWAVKNGFDKNKTYEDIVTEFYWSGPGNVKIVELIQANKGKYSELFNSKERLSSYMFGRSEISVKQMWNAFTDNFDTQLIDEIYSGNLLKGSYRNNVKRIKELQKSLVSKAKANPSEAVIQKVPVGRYAKATGLTDTVEQLTIVQLMEIASDGMFKFSAWGEKTFATLPEFRYSYWDYMATAVMTLSKAEADKLVATAEKTLSTTTSSWARDTLKTLKRNAKNADTESFITIDDLHNTASKVAARKIGELFYDANKRNAVGHALRFISPFGQAWANSMLVWGKLAGQNLGQVYRAEQFLKSLESEGSSWIYDPLNQNDGNQPFIYKDPATGKKVFGIPLVGELGGLLAGNNLGQSYGATMDVGSLNLIMQNGFAPGFGPVVQIAENVLAGNDIYRKLVPDELRTMINPYAKDPNAEFNALGTVTPAWFQELFAQALFPEKRNKYTTGAMLTLMQSNPEKYLDENGVLDSAGQQRLTQDAIAVSNGLSVARGLTQFFAPGATKLEAKFKDADGRYMLSSVVSNEYFTYLKQGYDSKEAMAKLVDTYGAEASLTMITANRLGYTPTDDAWEIYKTNPALFEQYSTVLPLIYPGGGYSTQLANYMSTGTKRLNIDEQAVQINRLLRSARESALDVKLVKGQVDAYTYKAELDKISKDYTGAPMPQVSTSYRESVISDLTDAMEDPTLSETPVGQSLKVYMDNRNYVASLGVGLDAKKQSGNRQKLFELGTQLAAENPQFAVVWFKVLRSEVKPQDVR